MARLPGSKNKDMANLIFFFYLRLSFDLIFRSFCFSFICSGTSSHPMMRSYKVGVACSLSDRWIGGRTSGNLHDKLYLNSFYAQQFAKEVILYLLKRLYSCIIISQIFLLPSKLLMTSFFFYSVLTFCSGRNVTKCIYCNCEY